MKQNNKQDDSNQKNSNKHKKALSNIIEKPSK